MWLKTLSVRIRELAPFTPRSSLGAVDVKETDNAYEFDVDVPGLTKNEIKVRISCPSSIIPAKTLKQDTCPSNKLSMLINPAGLRRVVHTGEHGSRWGAHNQWRAQDSGEFLPAVTLKAVY